MEDAGDGAARKEKKGKTRTLVEKVSGRSGGGHAGGRHDGGQ